MQISIRNNCSDFDGYRAARVKSLFNCESGCDFALDAELPIDDGDWRIGVVVGPSGSGKSSIARALWPDVSLYAPSWSESSPIIEEITPDGGFDDVPEALSAVGLGSVPAWLRPFHVLSNGEQFRATMGRLLAEAWSAPRRIERLPLGNHRSAARRSFGRSCRCLEVCRASRSTLSLPEFARASRAARAFPTAVATSPTAIQGARPSQVR